MREVSRSGVNLNLENSEETSGGWLAAASTKVHDWPVRIEWNVSLREKRESRMETTLVTTPLWPAYTVRALPAEEIVFEKIEALLRRRMPRDFFDLYFLLRERLDVAQIARRKRELLAEVKHLNARSLARELREFLPRTHWGLLKDLPRALDQELRRL